MTFSPFVPIPLYFLYAVAKDGKKAFQPSLDWRAANADDTSHSGIGMLFLSVKRYIINLVLRKSPFRERSPEKDNVRRNDVIPMITVNVFDKRALIK